MIIMDIHNQLGIFAFGFPSVGDDLVLHVGYIIFGLTVSWRPQSPWLSFVLPADSRQACGGWHLSRYVVSLM